VRGCSELAFEERGGGVGGGRRANGLANRDDSRQDEMCKTRENGWRKETAYMAGFIIQGDVSLIGFW
jgi:hypothetical protein